MHKGIIAYSVGVLLLAGSFVSCSAAAFGANAFESNCGKVHITVSADRESYVELNWISDCSDPNDIQPDYIALYNTSISDGNEETEPLVKILASDYPDGYYKTTIEFGQPSLPGNWEYNETLIKADPGPHCYPYWIASIKGSEIIDTRCLSIQPTWMNDNREKIGGQKIGSLLIPGTHNAGAFSGISDLIEGYVLCQDRSIWTQLVHGIRFIDLRIAYYGEEGFFINHDLVRITSVVPILEEIRKFVQLAPKEVIVVDFHRFPYPTDFNSTLHHMFVDLVKEYLGEFAVPEPTNPPTEKGPTLNEIWAQNKSLIFSYAESNIAKEYSWLWQSLQQHWGDTTDVAELKDFLQRSIADHQLTSSPMYALMSELTPQAIDIILQTNNLRDLANTINPYITKWFRDEWSKDTNIVASDYFLGNDMINVAIEVNKNR